MTVAFAAFDVSHLPILLVVGFALFAGTLGARVFQRLRIPQVVGYITIGLLVGQTGLGLIDRQAIKALDPFNFFALGVIGFMVGGELHRDVFRKYGRQFLAILLAEGLGAFVAVTLLAGAVVFAVTGSLATSLGLGLLFGAISSATAPAATVNVLWEYKARGVLTSAVFAILALDDGLALILFSIAAAVAGPLTGAAGGDGLFVTIGRVAYELIGAAVLGVLVGVGLNFLLRRAGRHDSALTLTIGTVALLIGGSILLRFDIILAAMALGVTLTNLAGRRSREAFQIVERFSPPIYVLFFVIAGAHINAGGMPLWMWGLAGAYLVGRTGGKMLGAAFGARLAGAAPALRKYLGLCLFCQGGVDVGLAILASARFADLEVHGIGVGGAIMLIIAVTTLVVEVLGPPAVKYAITKAGEVGLNVTEDDLIASYAAGDVMDTEAPTFAADATLGRILGVIALADANAFPVTDGNGRLVGVITIQELKQSFSAEGLSDFLVAADLMQPPPDTVTAATPLADALDLMSSQHLDALPVVAAADDPRLVGLIEQRAVNRRVSEELLRRHRLADGAA